MTPLVQMHQMVQPSAYRESRPKSEQFAFAQHGHYASRMSSAFHGLVSSHRAFPTRISQPAQPAAHPRSLALSHISAESAEHHLRRKTPNGTIDAGYDGSPAHLASGPPPLKHMILPGNSTNLSFGMDYERPASDGWAYRPPVFNHHVAAEPRGFTMVDSLLSSYGSYGAHYTSNPHSTAYYPYDNGMQVPTVMQPNMNQSPGPAVFNNGAVLPNSAWPEFAFNGQPNAILGMPYHVTNRPGGAGGVMPRYDSHANLQTPAQGLERLSLEPNPSYYEYVESPSAESPTAFREKALMKAHRSCIELLTHLHQTKKSHFGRYAHGSRAASRMLIFPKLPKAPMPSRAAFDHPQSLHTPPHYINYDSAARTTNNTPRQAGVPQYGPSNPAHAPIARQLPNGFGEISNHNAYYQMPHGETPRYVAPDVSHPYFVQTPIAKAKESADILHNLCEQSGWKWVEGMILGGCLYYGLERYEDALEWFSRVLSLDDRNDEAERHWLRAVRLNPSYLEAVEHLVGLFCSTQRSKEARFKSDPGSHKSKYAETCTPEKPEQHADSQDYDATDGDHSYAAAYGFGSSGYRVAGCENGRIIALIHAKGNMLYALKDIDRASDAFEEAVLISAGRSFDCIQSLIHRIHSVLSPASGSDLSTWSTSGPLLLPPDKARHTAQHVFASNGELPGLRYVPAGASKEDCGIDNQ
ncbi:UDP-N-acetylglucosaminyltransferase [Apiospora phragmitis]|uniref:UDP-N-acetylglucosaminyltransferase n=1 Tax=Apiospora phragmitis TaxID=2905665 RepID=A0ABR1UIU9_9PEZI